MYTQIKDTTEKIIRDIVTEAESWQGTPYVYGACVKGKGIDCARFIVSVYKKVGLIPPGFEPPHQHRDWHRGKNVDKKAFVNQILKFSVKVPFNERQPGDVVSFLYNKIESHLGIIVEDDCVIHAVSGKCVKKQRLRSYGNVLAVYRSKELMDV